MRTIDDLFTSYVTLLPVPRTGDETTLVIPVDVNNQTRGKSDDQAFDVSWCAETRQELSGVHCRTEREAQAVKAALAAMLAEFHLELHSEKTRIVYCKDGSRKGNYPIMNFDFLGHTFRRREPSRRRLPVSLFRYHLLTIHKKKTYNF